MEQENKTNKQEEREFFPESKENIAAGAKVFSEKASDIFSRFYEKVKEAVESAYEKGTDLYESLSVRAQNYIEKYRDRSEMASLQEDRDEVAQKIGYMCFMEYSGRYRFRVEFMKDENLKKLMAQMRELDKEIIRIGEKLESEE
ncbi:MAG: hypothetical protein R6U78_14625 [Bacteroidales bacterium]